ncbi:hypothetical protein HUW63_20855 [Myxococcus sp. AM001]|nr:hypothetical protein [Myxococcus sp. AM001]
MIRFSGWIRLVLMSAVLSAPSALAGRTECEADCGGKAGGTLAECTSRCPNGGRDAACASRCTKKFQEQFAACSKRCPPRDNIESPRKTGSRPQPQEFDVPDEGVVVE